MTILGYKPRNVDKSNDLIDVTLENPLSERSQIFTEQSAIFSTVNIEDFQSNMVSSIIKLVMMPFVVPFRVCKYFFLLPFKWIQSTVDKFIMIGLNKLNISKVEAKTYVTKTAKNQVINLRNFLVFFVIFLIIFSMALCTSASLYTGLYYWVIPY
jgi:hypothetical protein